MIDATFLDKVRELADQAHCRTVEVEGFPFAARGMLQQVTPAEPRPQTLELTTLTGLVDFIKYGGEPGAHLLVQVAADEVNVYGRIDGKDRRRDHPAKATFRAAPFPWGNFVSQEEFIIRLLANFTEEGDRDAVVKFASSLQEEESVTLSDDGKSQNAVARTGIASLGQVKVPNPVLLAPCRTFPELAQPLSRFVLRVRRGAQLALFEAEDRQWELAAVHSAFEYLTEALSELPGETRAVIVR